MPEEENAIRALTNQVRTLQRSMERLEDILKGYGMEYIPPKRRSNLPDMLEWWDDRATKGRDWKFYFPVIMSFIGPIIGGIIVVFITVRLK